MGDQATLRRIEVAERRQQREAQRRQRELERRAKEQAKLSAIEQARLEVETYENQLDVLLSVHKERGESWDWVGIAASLPPPCPMKNSYHELRAKQRIAVLPQRRKEGCETQVEQARLLDEHLFKIATQNYSIEIAKCGKLKNLARRILDGDPNGYTEVLVDFSPLAEISELGSSIRVLSHSAKLLECVLKVNGRQAIPAEIKSLTASNKLSVKTMPKGRFNEIYQDYLCACVLRVAREVLAMVPVETLLVTAWAEALDSRTGQTVEQPVLSVAMTRAVVERLEFDRLDPSDAMHNFLHRDNFKASRKSEVFQAIVPLTPVDIIHDSVENIGLRDLLASVQRLRETLKSTIAAMSPNPTVPEMQT